MQELTSKRNRLGSVSFYGDTAKRFFLAKPRGVANPSLLREDLAAARAFAKTLNAPWTYVTNTEDVYLVNPLNLLYLKQVKKIPHLKRIVIFAPNPVNRLLLKLVSRIVCPDTLLTTKREFEKFLEKGH